MNTDAKLRPIYLATILFEGNVKIAGPEDVKEKYREMVKKAGED